jgi:hypothetical protein
VELDWLGAAPATANRADLKPMLLALAEELRLYVK